MPIPILATVIRLIWISVEYRYLRRFRIRPVKSSSNWFSLVLSSIPFFVAAFYRMRIEDQTLQEVFGLEFVEYSTATKLLIPKIY